MSRLRVSHRLPTAAVLTEGIASVDSPWKTLLGKTKAARPGQRSPRVTPSPCLAQDTHQLIPAYTSGRIGSLSHWNMLSGP